VHHDIIVIGAGLAGLQCATELVSGGREVVVLDDNVAYVTGFDDFTAVRNGETKTSPNGFSLILVRRGNEWLIAHQHSSRRG
jgi:predicted oxidoreductase